MGLIYLFVLYVNSATVPFENESFMLLLEVNPVSVYSITEHEDTLLDKEGGWDAYVCNPIVNLIEIKDLDQGGSVCVFDSRDLRGL